MKRAMTCGILLAALAGLGGCERQDNTPKVDARLDGLLPPKPPASLTVFEDQRALYKKIIPDQVATAPAPVPTPTPAAATESSTPPEGATTAPDTTTPPPGDTPPSN